MTAPIDWGDEPEQPEQAQPARHTADTITSDALDQLYARIATLEHVAAGNKRHVQLIVPDLKAALTRAEQAERIAQSAARDTAKALTDYLAAEQRAEKAERAADLLADSHRRAEQAEAANARVHAELDRISSLDTINRDEARADTFSTGARWTVRHIRAALDEPQEPTQ